MCDSVHSGGQARTVGVVTPEIVAAGVDELRGRVFGESLAEIVTDVFYAMQAIIAATEGNDERRK